MSKDDVARVYRRQDGYMPDDRSDWESTTGYVELPGGERIDIVEEQVEPLDVPDEPKGPDQ